MNSESKDRFLKPSSMKAFQAFKSLQQEELARSPRLRTPSLPSSPSMISPHNSQSFSSGSPIPNSPSSKVGSGDAASSSNHDLECESVEFTFPSTSTPIMSFPSLQARVDRLHQQMSAMRKLISAQANSSDLVSPSVAASLMYLPHDKAVAFSKATQFSVRMIGQIARQFAACAFRCASSSASLTSTLLRSRSRSLSLSQSSTASALSSTTSSISPSSICALNQTPSSSSETGGSSPRLNSFLLSPSALPPPPISSQPAGVAEHNEYSSSHTELIVGVPLSSIHQILDSGRITPRAFIEMIQWPIERQPNLLSLAERLFRQVGCDFHPLDRSPVLRFERFIVLLSLFHPNSPTEAKVIMSFTVFDCNCDGVIDFREMYAALEASMSACDNIAQLTELQLLYLARNTLIKYGRAHRHLLLPPLQTVSLPSSTPLSTDASSSASAFAAAAASAAHTSALIDSKTSSLVSSTSCPLASAVDSENSSPSILSTSPTSSSIASSIASSVPFFPFTAENDEVVRGYGLDFQQFQTMTATFPDLLRLFTCNVYDCFDYSPLSVPRDLDPEQLVNSTNSNSNCNVNLNMSVP